MMDREMRLLHFRVILDFLGVLNKFNTNVTSTTGVEGLEVSSSFLWCESPEGVMFWEDIDRQVIEIQYMVGM